LRSAKLLLGKKIIIFDVILHVAESVFSIGRQIINSNDLKHALTCKYFIFPIKSQSILCSYSRLIHGEDLDFHVFQVFSGLRDFRYR
jgi:hypothetical protein